MIASSLLALLLFASGGACVEVLPTCQADSSCDDDDEVVLMQSARLALDTVALGMDDYAANQTFPRFPPFPTTAGFLANGYADCAKAGMTQIRDEVECQNEAEKLGMLFKGEDALPPGSAFPAGCFVSGGNAYFKEVASSADCKSAQCICSFVSCDAADLPLSVEKFGCNEFVCYTKGAEGAGPHCNVMGTCLPGEKVCSRHKSSTQEASRPPSERPVIDRPHLELPPTGRPDQERPVIDGPHLELPRSGRPDQEWPATATPPSKPPTDPCVDAVPKRLLCRGIVCYIGNRASCHHPFHKCRASEKRCSNMPVKPPEPPPSFALMQQETEAEETLKA